MHPMYARTYTGHTKLYLNSELTFGIVPQPPLSPAYPRNGELEGHCISV